MLLKIYAWTLLAYLIFIYALFIRDIEWHYKMLNLVFFSLLTSFLTSLGIIFLWQ
jgi:hypothetical protein